jgi:hypothetical protein
MEGPQGPGMVRVAQIGDWGMVQRIQGAGAGRPGAALAPGS